MGKGRKVPPPPPSRAELKALEDQERLQALLSGDPGQVRAWAAKWLPDPLNTIALADDESLRQSMASAVEALTTPIDQLISRTKPGAQP